MGWGEGLTAYQEVRSDVCHDPGVSDRRNKNLLLNFLLHFPSQTEKMVQGHGNILNTRMQQKI